METLRHDAPDALPRTAQALDARALAVVPTDTLYALAADALDEEAVARVFDAKGRAADQPLPVCVAGPEDAHHVADMTPLARRLADAFWPGAVTLVLRRKAWVPDAVTAGGPTVAVRVPAHPFARALARQFGPFTVTSANASGAPPPARVEDARASLGARVDVYVDGGVLQGTPSTIVDATGTRPEVLREGAVATAEIARRQGF